MRGRKPKAEGERRQTCCRVRLTQGELEAMDRVARSLGYQVSAWVRVVALQSVRFTDLQQRRRAAAAAATATDLPRPG